MLLKQDDKNFSSYCFEKFFNSILKLIQHFIPHTHNTMFVIIHMFKVLFAAIEDQQSVLRARLNLKL